MGDWCHIDAAKPLLAAGAAYPSLLPDCPYQRTPPYPLIARHQRHPFRPGRSPNQPVRWIARIVVRKLRGQGCYLWRDRQDCQIFEQKSKRGFNRAVNLHLPASYQHRKFPHRDRRDRQSPATARAPNCRGSLSRKLLRIVGRPGHHVRVEQNHRKPSQSSRGTTGDSISPTIFITPFSLPMKSSFLSSTGTSLAIGFPRFVITSGSRVERTSSMRARHRALNSPAAIFFMVRL